MAKEHYNQKWVNRFGACAMTFGKHIFYDTDKENVQERIRKHELRHVNQYELFGVFGFLMLYLYYYFEIRLKGKSHWEAYNANPFEIEARKAERF